ncbi:YbaN family protein, partial [Xanthomonas phaseoli]
LHNWLLSHPRFGPAIVEWQTYRAVSRKAKWMATLTMTVCAAIMLWCVPVFWVKCLSIGSMAVVAIWLWLRPEPPPRPLPGAH